MFTAPDTLFTLSSNIKKVIVFDVDDTFIATEVELTRWINTHCGLNHQWVNRLDKNCETVGPALRKALANASFMATGGLVEGFESFPNKLAAFKEKYPDVLPIFGTHRGYTPLAPSLTQKQFTRLGIDLDGVFLDPDQIPCKKTYFDAKLTGVPYIIFDDNPKWGGGVDGTVDNVYLMDKVWNQKETAYQRVYSSDELWDIATQFAAA